VPRGIFPRGFGFWTALLLVGLFLPAVSGGLGFLSTCGLFAIYAAVNLMWSLVLGTAGIYSFATLAIVGASGYSAAYLSVAQGWPWPAMLAVGTVAGALLGLIIAVPAIRLRGVYFALLTFGLAQLFSSYTAVTQALGGAQGLYGAGSFVPRNDVGTHAGALIGYYAGLALVIAALVIFRLVDGGRLGLLLRTSRESEPFARAVGINVVRARLGVFIASSAMLGFVGGFYACFYRGISPTIFDFDTLLLLFAMIVVGGLGSARGILIGTGILLFIDQHYLQSGPARLIAAAALMLVVTLFTRRGLVGVPEQVRAWLATRRARRGEQDVGVAAGAVLPGGALRASHKTNEGIGREVSPSAVGQSKKEQS
jgi:branched-chain amino acid transport system permease protein